MRQLWRLSYPEGAAVAPDATTSPTIGDLSLSNDADQLVARAEPDAHERLPRAARRLRARRRRSPRARVATLISRGRPRARALRVGRARQRRHLGDGAGRQRPGAVDRRGGPQLRAGLVARRAPRPLPLEPLGQVADLADGSGRQQPRPADAGRGNSNWPRRRRTGAGSSTSRRGEGSLTNLCTCPLEGGEPERLTGRLSRCARPSRPTALDRLLVQGRSGRARRGASPLVPADGRRRPRTSSTVPQNEADGISSIRWTTDGRALVYTDYRDGVTNLRLQPLAGGEARARSPTSRARSSTPSTSRATAASCSPTDSPPATSSSSATRAKASQPKKKLKKSLRLVDSAPARSLCR